MAIVKIHREIARRVKKHDGLWKALGEFVSCCRHNLPLPRIYKPSGVAKDGSCFDPYLRLNLYHHHLHRSGDPLLVTQHFGDDEIIQSVGLTTHADHIGGDKMLWLKIHADAIDWDGCEDLEAIVRAYIP